MIGESIRKLRMELGVTQATLAKSVDAAQTYISQLELGKTKPSVEMIKRLAEALKCDPEILLSSETQEDPKPKENSPVVPVVRHNLSYWGAVVDSARAAAARGDFDELDEIKLMLDKALDAVEDALEEVEPEA